MSDRRGRERGGREGPRSGGPGAADRRTRLLRFAAGGVFLTIAVVVVLVVVNAAGNGGGDTELEDVASANALLKGIPQRQMTLGDRAAPVKLYEYGDLQCPFCRAYAESLLPPIIESQVKNGRVSITFRNYVILGPESVPAGMAALAAGEQGRGWNFLEIFYRNQGEEESGYVTEEFIEAVGGAAGLRDFASWNEARRSERLEEAVETTTEEAKGLGFTGTPSLAIEGPQTDGLETLGTPESTADLEAAIAEAS